MNYNFDVAFSFLKGDLSFALEIKKHLPSSVKDFIFAERQEVLAGKDGQLNSEIYLGMKQG